MELINKLNSFKDNKSLKWKNYKVFDELFCLVSCVLMVLAWLVNYKVGYVFFSITGILSLVLLNDIKYLIVCAFGIMFSNREGFNAHSIPVLFLVCLSLLVCALIFYFIRNRKEVTYKNLKTSLPFLGLAVLGLIPLLWNTSQIPQDGQGFYFLYLNNTLYFVLIVLFTIFLKEDSFKFITTFFFYLLFVIVFQLIFGNIWYFRDNPTAKFLDAWFYIGWGLCNEAGILICFILPFLFIKINSAENIKLKIVYSLSILVAIAGAVLSGSRGTYLFFTFELVGILVYLLIKQKSWKLYLGTLVIVIVTLITIQCTMGMNRFLDFIYTKLMQGNGDNGRFEIWKIGLEIFCKSPISLFLGSGFACHFYWTSTYGQFQYVPMVYHSTLFETITVYGFLGLIFLMIHLCQKYMLLNKFKGNNTYWYLLIGFIGVDLYGLIDNTYHMWYFMVPLMMVMASIIKTNNTSLVEGNK